MFRRRLAASFAVVTLSAACVAALPGTAGADPGLTAASTAWLVSQQQPDGGFEVAAFPGFETSDAVYALAAQAQTGSWDTTSALSTVLGTKASTGKTPLDALDDWAETGLSRGQAAKLIALVARPLGLDPSDFDWACDGGPGANLVATMGSPDPDGSYGPTSTLNATLYGAIASRAVNGSVDPATVTFIRAAQQANGSWNYDGNPAGADQDIDTTSLALQALAAAGVTTGDADYDAGVAFLAGLQQPNGSWRSFGADDPNSTSSAILGLLPASGTADLAGAVAWLQSQVQPNGHIASPNDGFGVNTFATAQGIQGIQLGTSGASGSPGFPALTAKASTYCAAQVTTTVPTTAPVSSSVAGNTAAAGTLPRTGGGTDGPSGVLLVIGCTALVLGAGLVRIRTRAVRRTP